MDLVLGERIILWLHNAHTPKNEQGYRLPKQDTGTEQKKMDINF